jgi:hypothetical protein
MATTLQHQIIEGALHLIADKKRWTRCSMARTSEGNPCSVWDPAAVSFCAVGAMWRAAFELTGDLDVFPMVERTALQVIASNGRADALQTLNDVEGHAAVVQMFRTALAGGNSASTCVVLHS